MQEYVLEKIVDELATLLPGRFLGKVIPLPSSSLALDFGIRKKGYLFISIEPAAPRLYLTQKTTRELEKQSVALDAFTAAIRTKLGGAKLLRLTRDENERVVRMLFEVADSFGQPENHVLVLQLTGRSSNLFLLDASGRIAQAWRNLEGKGQQPGDSYLPPRPGKPRRPLTVDEPVPFELKTGESVSEAAERFYSDRSQQRKFEQLAAELRAKLHKETTSLKRLEKNLKQDLAAHGDPEAHKRAGDLLLANVADARRIGNKFLVTDYFAEGTPTVEIESDKNATLPETAATYFSRYTKAKRARSEIGDRLKLVQRKLKFLETERNLLETTIGTGDLTVLLDFEKRYGKPSGQKERRKAAPSIPGVRRYRSSDGYEVLVGKTARDNDQLTFRIARPNDIWLHAGDYPGSHVVIRNSSKSDIPHRTIIEAAKLAAKFSQAGKDTKVTIHYTRRKFLTRPKGAAPGLVRMSSFKTLTVAPGEEIDRVY